MRDQGLEALWVDPGLDFRYLTGHVPLSLERLMGLVIPARGEPRLVVPLLLRDEIAELKIGPLHVWSDAEGPDEAAAQALRGLSRLHVGEALPAWGLFALREVRPELEVELDPGIMAGLRERKDAAELAALERAGRAADEVMAWVGSLPLFELTEVGLAGRIQARFLEQGLEPSPHPLVASGPPSAKPHYAGEDVPLQAGRVLLLDFGCRVEGYWSDITRLYVPARPEPELEEILGIVREAYQAGLAAAAPGVPCQEVDRAARGVIEQAGYGKFFLHRTGHGLGLDVHEPPYIREGNPQPLEVGHVFSIEPGIYLEGRFGVRYENIVHMTEDGPRSFNRAAERFTLPEGEAQAGAPSPGLDTC